MFAHMRVIAVICAFGGAFVIAVLGAALGIEIALNTKINAISSLPRATPVSPGTKLYSATDASRVKARSVDFLR